MKLHIHNINKIHEADVNLDGLTLIAGINSTGKSTIGKVLFSMLKACNNAYLTHGELRAQKLNSEIDDIYEALNDYVGSLENKEQYENDIAVWFPLPISLFKRKIELYTIEANGWKQMKKEFSIFFESLSMNKDTRLSFIKRMENIYILTSDGNAAADSKVEFDKFIDSEFMGNLCSIGSADSNIEITDSTGFELKIKLSNNTVKNVNSQKIPNIVDATYVESPLYLHILDSIVQSVTYLDMPDGSIINKAVVPAHIKDLAEKVCAIRNAGSHNKSIYSTEISDVSGGNFEYNKNTRQIEYNIDGKTFNPINVASGMKAFGLLQLLLDMNFINEKKVLIWDEPENHLHPEWQVEFAKIVVDLARNGIKILISTHSPYFLQGVRYYAAKYDAEKWVNYYMTETDSKGYTILKNMNNTLNDIYQTLTYPLLKIMNVDAQRKNHGSKGTI